jgi:hypothetical protein
MVKTSYHLTDYHAQVLAGLPKDMKQKIIHDHELNDLSEDTLAKLHNFPVEVVWAIIVREEGVGEEQDVVSSEGDTRQ